MLRAYRRASLTIEAAAVLPLFMFAAITLVSVLFMNLATMRIQACLLIKAQDLAKECAGGNNVSITDVREDVAKSIQDEDVRMIENGRDGIDMSASDIDDPEYIDLDLSCDLVPFTNMFGALHIPLKRHCLTHAWCGYDHAYFGKGEYVYVTDDSEVYHFDRDCTHIRLTIEETTPGEVKILRNNKGSRYRACEICHARLSDPVLYITPEGDRYHKSITCSGLKRTVRAVHLSEVGDKRPCSRCGR